MVQHSRFKYNYIIPIKKILFLEYKDENEIKLLEKIIKKINNKEKAIEYLNKIKEKIVRQNTIKDFVLVSTKIKKDDKNSIFTIKNRKIMYKPPNGEKMKNNDFLHKPLLFMDKLSEFLNNL